MGKKLGSSHIQMTRWKIWWDAWPIDPQARDNLSDHWESLPFLLMWKFGVTVSIYYNRNESCFVRNILEPLCHCLASMEDFTFAYHCTETNRSQHIQWHRPCNSSCHSVWTTNILIRPFPRPWDKMWTSSRARCADCTIYYKIAQDYADVGMVHFPFFLQLLQCCSWDSTETKTKQKELLTDQNDFNLIPLMESTTKNEYSMFCKCFTVYRRTLGNGVCMRQEREQRQDHFPWMQDWYCHQLLFFNSTKSYWMIDIQRPVNHDCLASICRSFTRVKGLR